MCIRDRPTATDIANGSPSVYVVDAAIIADIGNQTAATDIRNQTADTDVDIGPRLRIRKANQLV